MTTPPKPNFPKVLISVSSFNEIAAKLEAIGYKFGENVGSFTVERGTNLVPDKDFRMVNYRHNAATIASSCYDATVHGKDFTAFAEKVFDYIYDGKVESKLTPTEAQSKGWTTVATQGWTTVATHNDWMK